MGIVYKAIQTDLKRVVAVKMILAGPYSSAEIIARFRTEAEAIARLQHPHIVQVYDLGEHEGLPFFCLEFCAGGSLARKIKGAALHPAEAAALVEKLARAMHAAHQRNIVHRDLKPANVLLTEDGIPKVTDFGLAKLLDAGSSPTLSDAIMGTPGYMAPEQVGGGRDLIGPRTDIYALGAILYECLVGRPPFLSPDRFEILTQVMTRDPVPPRRLQPKTPRDLETICLKCLHKEPAKRYATAEELAEDLRRYQAGEAIRARPLGPGERLWRWCRRQPALASLLVVLGLTIGAGLGGVLWQWRQAVAESRRADSNFREAQAQSRLAQENFRETLETVDRILTGVGEELANVVGSQPARQKLLEAALLYYQEFRTKHGDDPALQTELAQAPFRVARIYDDLGKDAEAVAAYEQARTLQDQLAQAHPEDIKPLRDLARTCNFLGVLHRSKRRWSEAEQALQQGLKIRQELVAAHPEDRELQRDLAQSLASIGVLHGFRAKNDRTLTTEARKQEQTMSLDFFERSLALRVQLAEGQPFDSEAQRDLAQSYNQIGVLKEETGRWEEVRDYYEKSLHIRQQVALANPRGLRDQDTLGQVYFNLGNWHRVSQRLDAARHCYEEASKIRGKLARDNPAIPGYRYSFALTLNNLGYLYRQLGNFQEAVRCFEEALPILEELDANMLTKTEYPRDLVMVAINRGATYRDLGRPEDAVHQFERLEHLLKSHPKDTGLPRRLAEVYSHLGRSLYVAGRWDEARCYYEEALSIRQKQFDERRNNRDAHRDLAESLHQLGILHREEGRWEDARVVHEKARTLREQLLKEDDIETHYDLGIAWNEFGQDLVRLNRREEAVSAFEQARNLQRTAFVQVPQMFKYRQGLRQAYTDLSKLYQQMGQPEKAAMIAAELTELEKKGLSEAGL